MARECNKCGKHLPCKIWINGKQLDITKRINCLECVPFNSTKIKQQHLADSHRKCRLCQKPLMSYEKDRCYPCRYGSLYKIRNDFVYAIVGEKCWYCGYSNANSKLGRRMFDFHHISKDTKSFSLNAGHITKLSWQRIKDELLKCVLLCVNCHREVHAGIIKSEEISDIYKKFWDSNKFKLDQEPPKDPHNIGIMIPSKENFLDTVKEKPDREELAKSFNVCLNTISRWAKTYGITLKESKKIPKEVLEKLLWKMPIKQIANAFDLSDNAIKKWAKSYNLSVPGRGYWAKPENRNYEKINVLEFIEKERQSSSEISE